MVDGRKSSRQFRDFPVDGYVKDAMVSEGFANPALRRQRENNSFFFVFDSDFRGGYRGDTEAVSVVVNKVSTGL